MTLIDFIAVMILAVLFSFWLVAILAKRDLDSGKLKIIGTNQGIYVERNDAD